MTLNTAIGKTFSQHPKRTVKISKSKWPFSHLARTPGNFWSCFGLGLIFYTGIPINLRDFSDFGSLHLQRKKSRSETVLNTVLFLRQNRQYLPPFTRQTNFLVRSVTVTGHHPSCFFFDLLVDRVPDVCRNSMVYPSLNSMDCWIFIGRTLSLLSLMVTPLKNGRNRSAAFSVLNSKFTLLLFLYVLILGQSVYFP